MSPQSTESQGETQQCMASLRRHLETLLWWRMGEIPPDAECRPRDMAQRVGLASTARIADALARRFLRDLREVLPDDEALLLWYRGYCLGLLEIGECVQAAVKNGSLTLRSTVARAPLHHSECDYWLQADLREEFGRTSIFPDAKDWSEMGARWPDTQLAPPGAVYFSEADAWAVGAGLVEPGELKTLYGVSQDDSAAISGAVQSSAAPPGGCNHNGPEQGDSKHQGATWLLERPQRFNAYTQPLYDLLAQALAASKPKPKAIEVLAAWQAVRPLGVTRVMADSLEYMTDHGETKTANKGAISKAIARMTGAAKSR